MVRDDDGHVGEMAEGDAREDFVQLLSPDNGALDDVPGRVPRDFDAEGGVCLDQLARIDGV